jgi:hypothetical protein
VKRSKTPVVLGITFVVAVLVVLAYSSMNLKKHRVEVCMAYKGRTECRIASGTSQEFALRTATSNACALLAAGVTETRSCETTEPKSVRWLEQ